MPPPSTQSEKPGDYTASHHAVIDEHAEALKGYVTDPSKYFNNAAGLKKSKDGQHVLIPSRPTLQMTV